MLLRRVETNMQTEELIEKWQAELANQVESWGKARDDSIRKFTLSAAQVGAKKI